jgi:hypothetical protein
MATVARSRYPRPGESQLGTGTTERSCNLYAKVVLPGGQTIIINVLLYNIKHRIIYFSRQFSHIFYSLFVLCLSFSFSLTSFFLSSPFPLLPLTVFYAHPSKKIFIFLLSSSSLPDRKYISSCRPHRSRPS